MKECRRLQTNLRTMEKEILGNYEKIVQSGMIWSFADTPLFINFDLLGNEINYTDQLLKYWSLGLFQKSENNDGIIDQSDRISFHQADEQIIDKNKTEEPIHQIQNQPELPNPIQSQPNQDIETLYNRAEEISKQISEVVMQKDQNPNIYQKVEALKLERRVIWEQIEKAEMQLNSFDSPPIVNKSSPQQPEKPIILEDDGEIIIIPELVKNENSNNQNDDEINQMIAHELNNYFNEYQLSSIEHRLIHSIIKNSQENFALIEKNNRQSDLCYLIPGLIEPKLTVIVMAQKEINDRLNSFQNKNLKIEKVPDTDDVSSTATLYTRLFKNNINFLYVTPEIFKENHKLLAVIKILNSRNSLNRIVLYENIQTDKLPEVPLLFIQTKCLLNKFIKSQNIFKEEEEQILIKENLFLTVKKKVSPLLTKNMNDINKWMTENHLNETNGIILCLTNRDCESINSWLNKNGHNSAFMNSIMNDQQCQEVIMNYLKGNISIVVMSIKKINELNHNMKQNIRYIIHYTMPMSIDEYLIHLRLVGNDGLIAFSLIMFSDIDVKIVNKIVQTSDESFHKMIEYCSNEKEECRRRKIGGVVECNSMCDNCLMKAINLERSLNVTNVAVEFIKVIFDLLSKNIKPTIQKVIDVYIDEVKDTDEIKRIELTKIAKTLCDRNILCLKTELTKYGEIYYLENVLTFEGIIENLKNESVVIY